MSKAYAAIPGPVSLILTYLFILALVGAGAAIQRQNLRAFLPGFTAIFGISAGCWMLGHYAYIASRRTSERPWESRGRWGSRARRDT